MDGRYRRVRVALQLGAVQKCVERELGHVQPFVKRGTPTSGEPDLEVHVGAGATGRHNKRSLVRYSVADGDVAETAAGCGCWA